ncbi:hypothetical protein KIPB_003283 [Kipferlia bialata]|uniref:Guanylate cyclase domain-containing protein n=1 Tax=Kipferlia bialata TaxID=797122 RepID=A0A9K3CT64_9EUKA|nr:hypothetical protein KIPB_003283 [Kipferlia bialata]|eukprot:g3283.t1
MCRMIAAVSLGVSALRESGIPLPTVEGIRAGVACGWVMCGVLGTYELMYDVFGDTVNTAARLMCEAGVFETLVTEEVAQRLQAPLSDALKAPELRHVEFAVSPPMSLLLKGKGACPVRRVYVAESDMPRFVSDTEGTLQTYVQAVLELGSSWTSRILSASAYLDTVSVRELFQSKGAQGKFVSPVPPSPEVPRMLDRPTHQGDDHALHAIFNTPWTVIRASFTAVPGYTTGSGAQYLEVPEVPVPERVLMRRLMFGLSAEASGLYRNPLGTLGTDAPQAISRSCSRPYLDLGLDSDSYSDTGTDSYMGVYSPSHTHVPIGRLGSERERERDVSVSTTSPECSRTLGMYIGGTASLSHSPSMHHKSSTHPSGSASLSSGDGSSTGGGSTRPLRSWQVPASSLGSHSHYNESESDTGSGEWVRQEIIVEAALTDTSDDAYPSWYGPSTDDAEDGAQGAETGSTGHASSRSVLPNAMIPDAPLTLSVSTDTLPVTTAEGGCVMWGLAAPPTQVPDDSSQLNECYMEPGAEGGAAGGEDTTSGQGSMPWRGRERAWSDEGKGKDRLSSGGTSSTSGKVMDPFTDTEAEAEERRGEGEGEGEGDGTPKDRVVLVLDALILHDIEVMDAAFSRGTPCHILTTQHRAHILQDPGERWDTAFRGLPSTDSGAGSACVDAADAPTTKAPRSKDVPLSHRLHHWGTMTKMIRAIRRIIKGSTGEAYKNCAFLTFHDALKDMKNHTAVTAITSVQCVLPMYIALKLFCPKTGFAAVLYPHSPISACILVAYAPPDTSGRPYGAC